MKRILCPFLVGLALITVLTCGLGAEALKVVASTSWTGAIAEAAGATAVDVLAPFELRHPPEYDFKPADIVRVQQADFVVMGGYEPFMKKLIEAAGVPESKVLTVFTDNVPGTLKAEARKLAAVFNSRDAEARWEAELDEAAGRILAKAKAKGLTGKKAVVHKFLTEYAGWFGLDIVGTFGGGEELTPVKMAGLIAKKPALVVDNYHNLQGAGVAAETKAVYVILINFPGQGGTRTLIDVLNYNARQFGL